MFEYQVILCFLAINYTTNESIHPKFRYNTYSYLEHMIVMLHDPKITHSRIPCDLPGGVHSNIVPTMESNG